MGVRESWGQGGSWNGGDMESQGCVAMESQRRGHSEGWKADSMGTGSRGVTQGLQAPGGVALPPAAGLVWFSEVAFLKGKGKTQTHRGGKAQLFDLHVGRRLTARPRPQGALQGGSRCPQNSHTLMGSRHSAQLSLGMQRAGVELIFLTRPSPAPARPRQQASSGPTSVELGL